MIYIWRLLLFLFILIFCCSSFAISKKIHVLVWSEGTEPKDVYPEGIQGAIAQVLKKQPDMVVSTASMQMPHVGLSCEKLKHIDVLIWFAHEKHEAIPDKIARCIVQQVEQRGMGFIALHSAHYAKPFKMLLSAEAGWADYRETGQSETIKILLPSHPIAKNVNSFVIPKTEIYLEPFQVPEPDAVVMEGIWDDQHKSREVMTWTRGMGRVVYIRAGHETYPIYFMPPMQQIIINATRWVAGSPIQKEIAYEDLFTSNSSANSIYFLHKSLSRQ